MDDCYKLLTEPEVKALQKMVMAALMECNGLVGLREVANDTTARLVVWVNNKLRSMQ